jgi:membrane-associated phospholipid phosphatase
MKLSLLVIISTIIICNCSCFSQQLVNPDSLNQLTESSKSRGPFSRLGGDLLTQLTSVFHMSLENSIWVGSGVLVAGALIASDQGTYNTLRRTRQNNSWMRKISPYISEFGSLYGISVIGAFAGFGLITKNQKALETSYLAAESFLTSGLWIRTLKLIAGRERPSARNTHSKEPGGEWWGLIVELKKNKDGRSMSSYDAFPSGHTATAFSIATIFANQYSGNLIVPVISYSLATLVGVARIVEDTHWVSDVFVGAVIGYLTSKEILNNNPSEVSRKEIRNNYSLHTKSVFNSFSWNLDPFQKSINLAYHF